MDTAIVEYHGWLHDGLNSAPKGEGGLSVQSPGRLVAVCNLLISFVVVTVVK